MFAVGPTYFEDDKQMVRSWKPSPATTTGPPPPDYQPSQCHTRITRQNDRFGGFIFYPEYYFVHFIPIKRYTRHILLQPTGA